MRGERRDRRELECLLSAIAWFQFSIVVSKKARNVGDVVWTVSVMLSRIFCPGDSHGTRALHRVSLPPGEQQQRGAADLEAHALSRAIRLARHRSHPRSPCV